jgi:hypothetical protein
VVLVLILELFIWKDIECRLEGEMIMGGLTKEKLMEERRASKAIIRKNWDYLNYCRT